METKSLYFLQKNILNVLAIMTVMCRLIGQLMSVNSLNRLEDAKIFSCEFFYYLYVKCDRLDFCVNVKEFWLLFVTCEKAKYFYVKEVFKVV